MLCIAWNFGNVGQCCIGLKMIVMLGFEVYVNALFCLNGNPIGLNIGWWWMRLTIGIGLMQRQGNGMCINWPWKID